MSGTSPLVLSNLPLFPLQSPLFPGGQLALKLFEVRYLSMMRKCHEVGAPFGVVLLTHGSEIRQPGATEQFHNLGTLATIDQLTSVQAGLLYAQCRGVSRFQIVRRQCLPTGLWVADVEQVAADPFIVIPSDLRYIAQALQRIGGELQSRNHTPWQEADALMDDCGWVANRWCELLPLKAELKQGLLATLSPLMRLELVGDILDKLKISPK